MCSGREPELRHNTRQRVSHALTCALLVVLLTTGCKHKKQITSSPEDSYQAIEQTFLAGDLLHAQYEAQSAFDRYGPSSVYWAEQFRLELAKIRLYQGKDQEVVALLDTFPSSGNSGETTVRQYLFLALARERLGQKDLCDRALTRAESLHPEGALYAEMMGTKGSIMLSRGDLDAAEHFFQVALGAAEGKNAPFLQTRMWMNLGVVALQQEHYEDALARFNQASSLAQAIGARVASNYALDNLGWLYYQTGDFKRALQNAQLAAAQAADGGATLDEVQALTNAGMIRFQSGDSAGALASYQQALPLAEALHNPEKLVGIHTALAYLLLNTDILGAEAHIRDASALARQRKHSTEELEASLLEGLLLAAQSRRTEAEGALLAVSKQAQDSPWLRWRAESTLAGLYADEGNRQEAEAWFNRAIETFRRQRDSLSSLEMQLPFFENGSDLYLNYMEYLIQQRRTGEALMVLDKSRAESLAEGLHQEAVGRQSQLRSRDLAARVGGTILVYCLRPEHSYLWAVDARQEVFYKLPGSEVILPLVERQTQAILASKDLLAQKDSTGLALYENLIRPAEAMVKPGGRIFLIPDQGLSGLNFETLVVPGTSPHYWIEDVSVTNARSLRLLAARRGGWGPAVAQRKMLLIGDPVYQDKEYAPLPNAADEMKGVASHFAPKQRTVFAGAAASPAAYASAEAGRYGYIHFVAHATADAMNPLDSAVVLSRSAGSESPYKLYAADILKHPLDAELITISSCYGSGARNYAGEGVVGLVWAFLRAGAHSVIGALWEVSDVSTPRLMDAMYGELLKGSPPDAALRSAKLGMLKGDGVFRKPLYWAAFQLYAGR